ncbi:MAG: sigma 54-interacting transcriptional regulator [Dehalobacterium sp.]
MSQELNIEMELFDTSFRPVFDSGRSLGVCQVVKSVWETKNKFLLLQKGKHYLCKGCTHGCDLFSGIFFPLGLPEVKVFALMAWTRECQNNLLNNQDSFIRTGEALVKMLESLALPESGETSQESDLKNGPEPLGLASLIGREPIMETLKTQVLKIAKSNSIVLIAGESGTGKELFARAVHDHSPRGKKPFIEVNCGAIPEALLESELFGYAPGSFTGASRTGKKGKFELAHQGTLFLDEIGDLPYSLQQKLLRVLETGKVDPIGGVKSKELDVRVVAATNQNLRQLVKEGRFRQDLYYRLNVLSFNVPPLRLRKKDIPLLTNHFLQVFSQQKKDGRRQEFTQDVMDLFLRYGWPGNIRELKNVVEYAVSLEDDAILRPGHLPLWFWENILDDACIDVSQLPLDKTFEDTFIQLLHSHHHSDIFKKLSLHEKKQLADKLGVSISTLYRKLKLN